MACICGPRRRVSYVLRQNLYHGSPLPIHPWLRPGGGWGTSHASKSTHSHCVTDSKHPLKLQKASRNGAWMLRLCNTQAKATPQAHRARRTIPTFTQLYVVRAFICSHYHCGFVPSLSTLLYKSCACACCVLLQRPSHTSVCVRSCLRECRICVYSFIR